MRTIVATGAALLIATSAGLGAYYGFTVGAAHSVLLGVALAAAAFGGELLKPFAFAGAVQALGAWQILRGVACLVVGLVCVVYSVASELALSAGSRGDLASKRGAAVETATFAREQHAAAKAEFDRLPLTKPKAELQALIAGVMANPRADGCAELNSAFTRAHCPKVTAWRAEMARAERREQLQATMTKAAGELKAAPAVAHADPLAAAIVVYAGAAGWQLRADQAAVWLHLLVVVFIEIGSAFGVIVVRTVQAAEAMRPVVERSADSGYQDTAARRGSQGKLEPASPARTPVATPSRAPSAGRARTPKGRRLGQSGKVSKVDAGQRIVDTLKDAGGKLEQASVRRLAGLIGGRKSTVHSALAALVAAGVVMRAGSELVLRG